MKVEEDPMIILISHQTPNKPSHTSSPVRENTVIYDFVSIIRLKYLKHMLGFSNQKGRNIWNLFQGSLLFFLALLT